VTTALTAANAGASLLRRVGTGDEIAQAVMPLAGDTYITGQTLEVNGGALFF
jgi:NAD(P)-dependent dehydrogenase (short-subunit alcohol dehydrogenase family)